MKIDIIYKGTYKYLNKQKISSYVRADGYDSLYDEYCDLVGSITVTDPPSDIKIKEKDLWKSKEISLTCEDCCSICLSEYTDEPCVELLSCSHVFHLDCIRHCIKNGASLKCPLCSKITGIVIGNQPPATMDISLVVDENLEGDLPGAGFFVVVYTIKSGSQNDTHPNPGFPYDGTRRTAFFPDTPEGRHVLRLVKLAFRRKLIFTVGTSTSTGKSDQTVWNGIHHKTRPGGGAARHGYPDPTYLARVTEELAALGVFSKDVDKSLSKKSKKSDKKKKGGDDDGVDGSGNDNYGDNLLTPSKPNKVGILSIFGWGKKTPQNTPNAGNVASNAGNANDDDDGDDDDGGGGGGSFSDDDDDKAISSKPQKSKIKMQNPNKYGMHQGHHKRITSPNAGQNQFPQDAVGFGHKKAVFDNPTSQDGFKSVPADSYKITIPPQDDFGLTQPLPPPNIFNSKLPDLSDPTLASSMQSTNMINVNELINFMPNCPQNNDWMNKLDYDESRSPSPLSYLLDDDDIYICGSSDQQDKMNQGSSQQNPFGVDQHITFSKFPPQQMGINSFPQGNENNAFPQMNGFAQQQSINAFPSPPQSKPINAFPSPPSKPINAFPSEINPGFTAPQQQEANNSFPQNQPINAFPPQPQSKPINAFPSPPSKPINAFPSEINPGPTAPQQQEANNSFPQNQPINAFPPQPQSKPINAFPSPQQKPINAFPSEINPGPTAPQQQEANNSFQKQQDMGIFSQPPPQQQQQQGINAFSQPPPQSKPINAFPSEISSGAASSQQQEENINFPKQQNMDFFLQPPQQQQQKANTTFLIGMNNADFAIPQQQGTNNGFPKQQNMGIFSQPPPPQGINAFSQPPQSKPINAFPPPPQSKPINAFPSEINHGPTAPQQQEANNGFPKQQDVGIFSQPPPQQQQKANTTFLIGMNNADFAIPQQQGTNNGFPKQQSMGIFSQPPQQQKGINAFSQPPPQQIFNYSFPVGMNNADFAVCRDGGMNEFQNPVISSTFVQKQGPDNSMTQQQQNNNGAPQKNGVTFQQGNMNGNNVGFAKQLGDSDFFQENANMNNFGQNIGTMNFNQGDITGRFT